MRYYGEDGSLATARPESLSPECLGSCPRCRCLLLLERVPELNGGILAIDPFGHQRWPLRSLLPLALAVLQPFGLGDGGLHVCPPGRAGGWA